MFYATYDNIGVSDIAEFPTKEQRNDWVNFRDPFSRAMGTTAANATFQRKAISESEFKKILGNIRPCRAMDTFNPGQKWYVLT